MTPLDRLRLEKAATDCGFEMTPLVLEGGLELRSARFPEGVRVGVVDDGVFEVTASDPGILDPATGVAALRLVGIDALYTCLRAAAAHARTKPDRIADEFKRRTAGWPRATEVERLAVQRLGQGLFRDALLDYWQGRCCVTGLEVAELLRASHIKPWARCDTDEERLDVFNGLLLAPHLDALFDAGLMTIQDDGEVLLAASLTHRNAACLGLVGSMRMQHVGVGHRRYLAFHRAHVWRG